ncbi:MAG: phytoene desaturase family protein [Candidatus Helarchaeota archaeon]
MVMYDFIIIGAGIGGLMAAASLCKDGKKVLVLEKLAFTGGRYTELSYKGYEVTTGSWTSMGIKSHIGRFCEEVGAKVNYITLRDRGQKHQPAPLFKVRFNNQKEIDFFKPLTLSETGLQTESFFQVLMKLIAKNTKITPETSSRDIVEEVTRNETILSILDHMVGTAAGLNIDTLPASELRIILHDVLKTGGKFGFPVGGVKSIIQALERVVLAHGGSIRTCVGVKRIIIEDNVAKGVELETGSTLDAKNIIHNAGAHQFLKLVGSKNLPTDYVQYIKHLKPVDCAAIILGLDKPVTSQCAITIPPDAERVAGVFSPTFFDPSVAPPGKHMIDVFIPLQSHNIKKEMELAWNDLYKLFPNLESLIHMKREMIFYKDWPGAESGQTFGQVGDQRLDPESPIENLYLCGMDCKGSGVAGDLVPVTVQLCLQRIKEKDKKIRVPSIAF